MRIDEIIKYFESEFKKYNFSEKEKWKLYVYFPCDTLFVDIETEGLSKERNEITLIGIFKNGKYYCFIKDFNLNEALNILAFTPIWVTFGGENFDLPFIKKTYPYLKMPLVHIDLFFLTKKIGLKGGLKKIEKFLGINRETDGLNGYDAVKLWKKWRERKDIRALRSLILYNKEDVVNLKRIIDYVIQKMGIKGRDEEYEEERISFI